MAKSSKTKEKQPKASGSPQVKARKNSPAKSCSENGKPIFQAMLIVVATGWVYWPVLHGNWIGDDRLYITQNPLLQDPARLWKAWFQPGSFIEYYPIEESVQWFEWLLFHNDTLGYHVTNVVLHLISALLVWKLLRKFGLRQAWLGGLIFAVHPVQVESVALISELKNTLSLPPFLLAMCAWIDYEEKERPRDYMLALGLFTVAMLCKITMATFPVVILLYAWWKRGRLGWSDVKASLPFFAISLVLGTTTILAGDWFQGLRYRTTEVIPLGGFFSRLALAGHSISFYFAKCFWPGRLLPLYPQWKIDPCVLWQYLPWIFLGGTIYLLWSKRASWGRHGLLGLGFFLIILAPFLGFNAVSYMRFTWVMDHFLYIPIIGWIGLVVAGLEQLGNRLSSSVRMVGAGAIAILMALMALESRAYAGVFISEETLCRYTIEHNPGATEAHNNLGQILDQAGQVPEAMEQYGKALEIDPKYVEAHANLGLALQEEGRGGEATVQLAKAVAIQPHDPQWHYTLGVILMKNGRVSEAIEQYQEALEINPDYAEAHNDLGMALLDQGKMVEAIGQYEQAVRIDPGDVVVRNNLGLALLKAGQFPEAVEQLQAAVQISPQNAIVRNNLGLALEQSGRISEARDQFEEALQINSSYAKARENLTKLEAHPASPVKP